MVMNNFGLFIAAYWKFMDEGGHAVNYEDARSSWSLNQKDPRHYEWLQHTYMSLYRETNSP